MNAAHRRTPLNETLRAILIFTVFYFPYVCARALEKPLWFDELATLLVARVDSAAAIFQLLSAGVDPQPPLSFLVTRWSLALPGNELITARIPEMVAFWLMSVCLYVFAARRGPGAFAWLAMLFPCASGLLYYATEARPYALVLGFSALALVAWQGIPESRYPFARRAVMFISLMAGILTHYFAVLIPCALFAGEAARSVRRKRVDWWTMASIAGSFSMLVILRPMLAAQRARLGVHWAHPALSSVTDFYDSALAPIAIPVLAIAIAVAIYDAMRPGGVDAAGNPPFEELVAGLAYLLIPMGAYLAGRFVSHTYTGRYSIAGLIGMALAFWWVARRLFRGSRSARLAAAILAALLIFDEARTIRRAARTGIQNALRDYTPFPFPGDLPIVVQDGRDFLPMIHYGPRDLAARLRYLSDANESMKYTGATGLDVAMVDLTRCAPLPVEDFGRFVTAHRRFLLFWGKPEKMGLGGWQMSKLMNERASFQVVQQNGTRLLFEVNLP